MAKNDALTCDNIYKEKKRNQKEEASSAIIIIIVRTKEDKDEKRRAGVATKNQKHDNESNNYKINGCSLCDNTRLAERFV